MPLTHLKTLAKQTVRRPTAKVFVTWGGGSVDYAEAHVSPPPNIASIHQQVTRGIGHQRRWAFCETDDPTESVARLDEDICAMPEVEEDGISARGFLVGWWGAGRDISDANGYFSEPYPILSVRFHPMGLTGYRIDGYLWSSDAEYSEWPVDFVVRAYGRNPDNTFYQLTYSDGSLAEENVVGNTVIRYGGTFREPLIGVARLDYEIRRWSRRGAFVKTTSAFDDMTREYDAEDIMDLSILEEADGGVGVLPIGNVSCNEMDLTLQNIDDQYFLGNTNSVLNNAARANRRIEPHVGFRWKDEYGVERIETIPKGVFWSRDWSVTTQGTGASTSALDRMGTLQNIEYRGVGNIHNPDGVAEACYWTDKTLREVAYDILLDLQNNYMHDLEFEIDDLLETITIPLAFFSRQSYFDVIRDIARAAVAYAYMDTPTEAERHAAHLRGNDMCADVLRIRKVERFAASGAEAIAGAEIVTLDDVITKDTPTKRENIVNVVSVPYDEYVLGNDGIPTKPNEWETKFITLSNSVSILDYGRLEHEYNSNTLIQTEAHAESTARRILELFGTSPRTVEMSTFGDVTRRVGDAIDVPEYQKRGIDARGYYAITRLQTEYDGGLRQSVSGRYIGGRPPETFAIDENGARLIDIDESGARLENVIELGRGYI